MIRLSALAILLGLGMLAGIVEARVRTAFRRWRCRREMQKIRPHVLGSYGASPTSALIGRILVNDRRRMELDGLATARDKAERKIP